MTVLPSAPSFQFLAHTRTGEFGTALIWFDLFLKDIDYTRVHFIKFEIVLHEITVGAVAITVIVRFAEHTLMLDLQ